MGGAVKAGQSWSNRVKVGQSKKPCDFAAEDDDDDEHEDDTLARLGGAGQSGSLGECGVRNAECGVGGAVKAGQSWSRLVKAGQSKKPCDFAAEDDDDDEHEDDTLARLGGRSKLVAGGVRNAECGVRSGRGGQTGSKLVKETGVSSFQDSVFSANSRKPTTPATSLLIRSLHSRRQKALRAKVLHQSINPSIHQSTNPPIHQSIYPSIHCFAALRLLGGRRLHSSSSVRNRDMRS
jgi:hypothetical protein